MIDSLSAQFHTRAAQARSGRYSVPLMLGMVALALAAVVLLVSTRSVPSTIGWLAYVLAIAAIIYQPRYGLYILIFFGLASDLNSIPWFPFDKGFSSVDSILFVNRALIFSPLESFLILTTVVWLARGLMSRQLNFYRGPLFVPLLVFCGFVLMGLAYGYVTKGDMYVGLWEARPLFYLPLMLILTSNLIETREQAARLVWLAMIALAVLAAIGILHFVLARGGDISRFEADIEHSAAIRLNTVYVMALGLWIYGAARIKLYVLALALPLVVAIQLIAERRAGFATLDIALALIALVLFVENRKLFWRFVPAMALIGLVCLAIFWNSTSPLGLPARTVRGVVSASAGTVQEDLSTQYRDKENYDIDYTIHHSPPWTGIGFGQKFFTPQPLPDISFFEWWQYFPHNSILWIWLTTGVGGFLALLFLIGCTIMVGVQTLLKMPSADLRAIALTAVLYIVMHFIFAYVDISWDYRSMLYVGMMMGLINKLPQFVTSTPAAAKSSG